MTTAQFKKWLNEKIVWLQEFPAKERSQDEHSEALSLIDQAFQHATDLRLADAAAACCPGRVDVRLLECLAAVPETKPELLTPPQLAKESGIKADTIRDWIKAGKLIASNVAKPGKTARYKIKREDWDACLEKLQPDKPTKKKPKPQTLVKRY